MSDKREKLAIALEEEKGTRPEFNYFGEPTDFEDYDLAIHYLKTGEHPEYYNDFNLLYACIEDFEQTCADYDIN